MTEKLEIHGHELEFLKNEGKAVIEIDLGDATDECYLIDIFTVDETDYVALISSESSDIYLFYYEDSFEEDEIELKMIDDEEELETVFHLFKHYWDDDALDQVVEEYENDLDLHDHDHDHDDEDDIIQDDLILDDDIDE